MSRAVVRFGLVLLAVAAFATACGESSDGAGDAAIGAAGQSGDSSGANATTADAGSQPDAGSESYPDLVPTIEIEMGPTQLAKSIAFSPDGNQIAVQGGGQGTDVDPFVRVFDANTGDQVGEIAFGGDVSEVSRLYWTAANQLVGIDILSFEPLVATWDATSLDMVGSYAAADFVCLSGINAFNPQVGAVYAFERVDGGSRLCRRSIGSDDLVTAIPLSADHDVQSFKLRGDASELVAGVWDDGAAQQYLMVRFDPTTLDVLGQTELGDSQLFGVGTGAEILQDLSGNLTLQPSGVALPSRLDRPSFSPDGSLLWARHELQEVEVVIDVGTGQVIGQFPVGAGHLYSAWSPDGTALAVPSAASTLQIYHP